MPILDAAVLVISGTDGVQAHTLTLWRLLESYRVPVFLFINKMDLEGADRQKLMASLQSQLSPHCVDFTEENDVLWEQCALCDDALLEQFLESGQLTEGNLRGLIGGRKLFPCCFGSALKLSGIDMLLDRLDRYAPRPGADSAFGARVYKISRDPQGNRLTWLKITGGSLPVRSVLNYVNQKGETAEEKVIQLRRYSGEKFTAVDIASAGQTIAVTGLSGTYAGLGLGNAPSAHSVAMGESGDGFPSCHCPWVRPCRGRYHGTAAQKGNLFIQRRIGRTDRSGRHDDRDVGAFGFRDWSHLF
jgi:translation elongation factor EF-G